MQHLTPVGLSKDGKQLILASGAGEEFAVPIDDRFRTALRGNDARSGQGEMKMESALRPRDIQSRIRAGESAEAVAAAAQTTVEGIMAFAAPVLAERAHVAQTAQKSSIRRTTSEASPGARTLDEASRQRLSALDVRADDVEWDAWRREDGRWSVVAEYIAGDQVHRAEFTYDQPGRFVLATNDEARLLTGEVVAAVATAEPTRRLSAVPRGDADELPLGDDALELVRDAATAPVTPVTPVATQDGEDADPTSDLSETAAAVRESAPGSPAQPTFDDLAADHADADWIAATPATPAAQAEDGDARSDQHDAPPELPLDDAPEPAAESDAESDAGPRAAAPATGEHPKKKGRSSVPSWDEIMFGGGKHE